MSSEQYREMLGDSFINGLSSSTIKQRLLERDDLTLQNAFEQACTLYRAHEQANFYGGSLSVTLTLQVNYLKMKFRKIRPQALARLCMQHLIPKFENASSAGLPTIIDLDVLLEMQIVTGVERKATLQRFACQNKRHHLPPLHLLPIV